MHRSWINRNWIGEKFAQGERCFYYADRMVDGQFVETVLYEFTSHYVHIRVYDMTDADMRFFRSSDDVWEGRGEL